MRGYDGYNTRQPAGTGAPKFVSQILPPANAPAAVNLAYVFHRKEVSLQRSAMRAWPNLHLLGTRNILVIPACRQAG